MSGVRKLQATASLIRIYNIQVSIALYASFATTSYKPDIAQDIYSSTIYIISLLSVGLLQILSSV